MIIHIWLTGMLQVRVMMSILMQTIHICSRQVRKHMQTVSRRLYWLHIRKRISKFLSQDWAVVQIQVRTAVMPVVQIPIRIVAMTIVQIQVQNSFYLSREDSHLQVVSNSKFVSVGVRSPTEINAPRGCAVILIGICQLLWPESRAKSHGRSTWITEKKACKTGVKAVNTVSDI